VPVTSTESFSLTESDESFGGKMHSCVLILFFFAPNRLQNKKNRAKNLSFSFPSFLPSFNLIF